MNQDSTSQHNDKTTPRSAERGVVSYVGNNRHPILFRFGRAVRLFRLDRHLTQLELAKKSGMSRSSISEIEHGQENVSLERAASLAQALGCRLTDLLQDEQDSG